LSNPCAFVMMVELTCPALMSVAYSFARSFFSTGSSRIFAAMASSRADHPAFCATL
jgi:hypothetical protein